MESAALHTDVAFGRAQSKWPRRERYTKACAQVNTELRDGLKDNRSARAKKNSPKLARCYCGQWAWDADAEYNEKAGDTEQWLIMLPEK